MVSGQWRRRPRCSAQNWLMRRDIVRCTHRWKRLSASMNASQPDSHHARASSELFGDLTEYSVPNLNGISIDVKPFRGSRMKLT